MDDVIFQGSNDKRPMNIAEVKLSFENKDRKLESDYDLVKVSRRIYRNGDNEYRLNGKKVRLRDIKELFLDTGIGKEGYSVIGQGRVEKILNSTNLERRSIFEEASGIATHKYRREESIKKLNKVEDDLEVINREWEYKNKDLKRLEKEAQNYDKYHNLLDKLDQISLGFFKSKSKKLEKDKKDLEKKIKELEYLQKLKTSDFNKIKDKLKPLSKSLDDLNEKKEKTEKKIRSLEKNIESYKNDIKLQNQKLDYSKKDFERVLNDNKSYKEKIRKSEDFLKKEKENLSQNKIDLKKLTFKKKSKEEEKQETGAKLKILKKYLKELDEKISLLDEKIYSYDLDQKSKELLNKERKENNKRLKERIKDTQKSLLSLDKDIESLFFKKRELNENIKKEDIENKNLKDLIDKKDLEIKSKEESLSKLDLSYKEEISSYKIQKSLLEKNEGYFYSVSEFLNKTRNTPIKDYYIDSLANLINVKEGYEKIIENLIGAGLQNIVTWSKNDTREIINYVNKNKLGRITFLPLDSIKSYKKQRVDEKEALAMAYDLVTYDKRLDNIINHFLSNTVVVKNIEDAISLSEKVKGYRIISLNLDVINTWGSMVAGKNKSRKSNVAILNRNKKISNIKKKILDIKNDAKDLSESLKEVKESLKIDLKRKDNLTSNIEKLKKDYENLNRNYEKLVYDKENLNKRLVELKESLQDEDDRIKDFNLDEEKEIFKKLKDKKVLLTSNISENKGYEDNLSKLLLKFENKIEIKNRDINIIENKLGQEENELINLNDSLTLNKKVKKSLESSILKQDQDLKKMKDKVKVSEKSLEESKEKSTKLKKDIDQMKNSNQKLIAKSNNFEKDLNDLSMKKVKINYDLEAISKDYKNLEDEIRPFVSKPVHILEDEIDIKDDLAYKKDNLFKIQKELSNVGFFEKDSKDKYKEANKDFNFLDKQKNDLEYSKKDIKKMIAKLEEVMKKEFIKKFNIIDEKFQRIFKELFMGGKSKLSLDSNDFLNAGIEIKACPPNKSTKSISLLSGGEKSLTAVALLFAIFETNPAPFSLLDEIDAAMDESNIKRYIDYLKSLSDKTQFIMITHRQTTMQLADKIHGVTIGDGGISKIYSIDFDNWSL